MSNPVAPTAEHLRTLRYALLWALVALVFLGVFYFVAARIERLVARWPQSEQFVSAAHCSEFIALAKATYGENWKVRLNPSDTTCAVEVQEAWEQQRISREAQYQATQTIVTAPPAPPVAPQAEARAPAAQTYCLNVISLAKAKHGADWASTLDASQRAACGQTASP
jgi:hypothetical protein